jgi:hypothetical protein
MEEGYEIGDKEGSKHHCWSLENLIWRLENMDWSLGTRLKS